MSNGITISGQPQDVKAVESIYAVLLELCKARGIGPEDAAALVARAMSGDHSAYSHIGVTCNGGCKGSCDACKSRNLLSPAGLALTAAVSWPTVIADEGFQLVDQESPFFSAPKVISDEFFRQSMLQSGPPVRGNDTINAGTATVTLSVAAGSFLTPGVYIELSSNDNVNLGDVEFDIAADLPIPNATVTGNVVGTLCKPGRAGFVYLFGANPWGGTWYLPYFAQLATNATVVTVPTDAFGVGVPPAPVSLNESHSITITATGADGPTVFATALSPRHPALGNAWKAYLESCGG